MFKWIKGLFSKKKQDVGMWEWIRPKIGKKLYVGRIMSEIIEIIEKDEVGRFRVQGIRREGMTTAMLIAGFYLVMVKKRRVAIVTPYDVHLSEKHSKILKHALKLEGEGKVSHYTFGRLHQMRGSQHDVVFFDGIMNDREEMIANEYHGRARQVIVGISKEWEMK